MKMLQANAGVRDFLLTNFEGGGSIGPFLVLAQKLLARGHKVRVMSDEANRPEFEAIGAEFIAWTRAPNRLDRSRYTDVCRDWEAPGPDGLKRWIDGVFCGPALEAARDVMDELRRRPADLAICIDFVVGAGIACEAMGQNYVWLACNPLFPPFPGATPMGMGLRPARSEAERAEYAAIGEGLVEIFDHGLPALNRAREALGLAPLDHMFEAWSHAPTFVASARAFDFNATFMPDNVHYAGPLLGAQSWLQEWSSPWSADDARPLIVTSFSTTFQDHAGAVQRVIDAAADLPVRLLVTLGGSIEAHEVQPAANTHVVHSAPHDQILPHAAAMVTHGGHGTVIRALRHGLPVLVLPHGRDQNDNAARVVEAGAGLWRDATSDTQTIREALRALVEDAALAQNARKLGVAIAQEIAQSTIVEDMESLAGAPFHVARV